MHTDNELISVIIPTYNHERYVQETIRSIINQTYKNLELIIIDDGSSDNTWEKINELKKECEKRFVRIVFTKQTNQGTSVTLKKLIAEADGAYILSIASDDRLYPDIVAIEHNFLVNHPEYVLVIGNNDIINEHSERVGWDTHRNSVGLDSTNCKYKTFYDWLSQCRQDVDFFSNNFGAYNSFKKGNYMPNGWMIRSSVIKGIDLSKKTPLEDLYLHLWLSKKGKYHYIDQILCSYRWHGNNTILNKKVARQVTRKTLRYELCRHGSLYERIFYALKDIWHNRITRK